MVWLNCVGGVIWWCSVSRKLSWWGFNSYFILVLPGKVD
jgi:hypothetical protein